MSIPLTAFEAPPATLSSSCSDNSDALAFLLGLFNLLRLFVHGVSPF
jgi:hypothetical protein